MTPNFVLNGFRGDSGCDFAGALRIQIARFDCDFKSLRLQFFCVFRLFWFSRVQIRNSGFSVFSAFSAFSGFQGSKSGIPVFPFFPLLRAPNPEFRGHGSGHVWCGYIWHARTSTHKISPCCKRSPAKGVWQKSDEVYRDLDNRW